MKYLEISWLNQTIRLDQQLKFLMIIQLDKKFMFILGKITI